MPYASEVPKSTVPPLLLAQVQSLWQSLRDTATAEWDQTRERYQNQLEQAQRDYTSLRIGEVIRLTIDDVLLKNEPQLLVVRDTKFHKSRIVPIHPSTAQQLLKYKKLRLSARNGGLSDRFFISE